MKKEIKNICKECGNELKQAIGMPKGILFCYECRKIDKIVNAIKELTSKVDIIIKRSQNNNL